ncbi:MAG: tol-pal system protein YbgF [Parvularculaceae bacterium]
MRRFLLAALALGAASIVAPTAQAGTKDRIEALEADVAQLKASATGAIQSSQRIDQLEREVRDLTGRLEEQNHQLDQMQARIDAISAALSGDIGSGDAGAMAAGPAGEPVNLASGAAAPGGDPIASQINKSVAGGAAAGDVALPNDAEEAYRYASQFLLSNDYGRAEKAFTQFLQAFPGHARAPDAKFRLGEVYLAAGKNAEAADTFIAFIRAYPTSARGAEAYLKLGTAFSRLNQADQACKVFKTLKTKYPNAEPAVLQRTDVEMARANCR